MQVIDIEKTGNVTRVWVTYESDDEHEVASFAMEEADRYDYPEVVWHTEGCVWECIFV